MLTTMTSIVSHFHTEAAFNSDDPKYRSCCHLCHAVTGVRIIIGITCVIILVELWHLALCIIFDTYDDLASWIWNIFVNCILVLTLFFAQLHENFLFLLPCLIIKATGVTIRIIFGFPLLRTETEKSDSLPETNVMSLFSTVFSSSNDHIFGQSRKLTYDIVACQFMIIVYHLWIVCIVMKCSKYYHDKHAPIDGFYSDMRTMVSLSTAVANPENARRMRSKHVTVI